MLTSPHLARARVRWQTLKSVRNQFQQQQVQAHKHTETFIGVFLCMSVHQVSTAEENGILLYNGDNEPIAVELHQGHVRVTYDPGNQPATAIYR